MSICPGVSVRRVSGICACILEGECLPILSVILYLKDITCFHTTWPLNIGQLFGTYLEKQTHLFQRWRRTELETGLFSYKGQVDVCVQPKGCFECHFDSVGFLLSPMTVEFDSTALPTAPQA